MKTAALILAAGGATRFGGPKQLLEIDGETLVDRACRIALEAGCGPVLRVLGARAGEILMRPEPAGVSTLVHVHWEEGMGGSLAAGVRRLLEIDLDCEAAFILLADQPLVSPHLLAEMRARLAAPVSMVLCRYGDGGGPPALFGRRHFPELAALSGDRGAKSLVGKHPAAVAWHPFPEGACDIDTPDAWNHYRSTMSSITDNTTLSRFELEEDGKLAFADYRLDDGVLVLPHVEADPALRGKGAAGRLMEGVLNLARERGWKVRPVCGYAVAYIQRHPGFQNLLA